MTICDSLVVENRVVWRRFGVRTETHLEGAMEEPSAPYKCMWTFKVIRVYILKGEEPSSCANFGNRLKRLTAQSV
jgi:hypothetical protein